MWPNTWLKTPANCNRLPDPSARKPAETGGLSLDVLSDQFIAHVEGSSKSIVVELRGFEPRTFSLRTRRATNCAIAPYAVESLARTPRALTTAQP